MPNINAISNAVLSQTYPLTYKVCTKISPLRNTSKLSSNLHFSISAEKGLDLVTFLKKDMEFISSVLLNTRNQQFNLTEMFVSSLHAANRMVFRIMKEILTYCDIKYVVYVCGLSSYIWYMWYMCRI